MPPRNLPWLVLSLPLLLSGRLPAQPASASKLDGVATQATCETEFAAGRYAQALPACQSVLRDAEKRLGPEHESVAQGLLKVSRVLEGGGNYAEAVLLVQRALRIFQKVHGDQHPEVATSLNNLAELYQAQGQYAQAEPLFKRSLDLLEKALGPGHPAVATSLNNLAMLNQAQGQYAQAQPLFKRSLEIIEKALGPDHPDVASSLNNLAMLNQAQGQYAQAQPLFKRSLDIREKALGPEHPNVASSLNNLAELNQTQGQHAQAEPLYKRSLGIYEKALGPSHPLVATSLNNLANLHQAQGQYAQAEPLYKRSLDIWEKTLGPGHPQVATSLNNLARLYRAQGQYAQAEPLLKRSLDLREKVLGPGHPDVATSLNNLALLYYAQGKYAQAEPLLKRSLDLREKAVGPGHPDVATSLNVLAGLYRVQGKYAQAEPLLKRSLDLREKALGPSHPAVATSLNNLAALYRAQGQYAQADPLYKRSLGILEKALGPSHPDVATSLNNLAELQQTQGQYAQAEPLLKRSLDISEKALGLGHPAVAMPINNLALLYYAQGQYAQAEPLLKRSLDIHEKALGPGHPDVAVSLHNLAVLYVSSGFVAQALPLLQRATSIREEQLRTTVSEARMQALLDTLRGEEDLRYGLLLRPELADMKELALQVALLRKGRVAAAGAAANLVVQRSLGKPGIARQFQEWQGVRQQHEALLYGGLGKLSLAAYRQRLQETKLQAETLEAQLASALPEIRALQPPKPDEIIGKVAAKLPAGGALIEVVWTRPYQGKAKAEEWGKPHYVALILFPDRRIEAVDLGEAATVDTLGLELRMALSSPGTDPVPAAKALYAQVMERLRAQLGEVHDLYLSLDGTLNVIPFDALHDEMDYLLERYRFHYLTSGRDLLRERSARGAGAPLLLANPEFGPAETAVSPSGQKSLYQRLAGLPALPGTLREAEAIAPLLGIPALVGSKAREEAVRGSAAPRILHIATHGLFLQDVELAPPSPQSGEVRSFSALQRERSKPVGVAETERLPGALSAMTRSALVLADAARGASAQDAAADGLLTADEARSLDLDGTQLVVLSACETGRGGLSAGQGVYGLRRAFLVAGAETLVTSLWRVNDAATGELMTAYYQKLLDRKQPGDRLGAMVEAMQELRAKPGRSHPYYWAPFLVIGSDGPLRAAAR